MEKRKETLKLRPVAEQWKMYGKNLADYCRIHSMDINDPESERQRRLCWLECMKIQGMLDTACEEGIEKGFERGIKRGIERGKNLSSHSGMRGKFEAGYRAVDGYLRGA